MLGSCKLRMSEYPYNAAELTEKYYLYERRANKQLLDKEIEVKGILSQVTKDSKKNTVIILARRGEPYGVKCTFAPNASMPKSPLELNTEITIKGTCKGLSGHVIITNCHLVTRQ